MERGATIADLASEFLARMSGSVEAGSSIICLFENGFDSFILKFFCSSSEDQLVFLCQKSVS